MCCCDKIKSLICVDACEGLITITGAVSAFNILNLEIGDTVQKIHGTSTESGVEFTLPELMVGNSYRYWIMKLNGDKYVDADNNDCFSIEAINFFS